MHLGKFVFAQIVEFLPRYEFEKCVKRYKGDFHTKSLNSYNHLLQLIFGQITSCTSLRDICLCLKAHQNNLYHLGIRQQVNQSSLSRANEKRDYRIFQDFGYHLIEQVRPLFAKERTPLIDLDETIFALDSTSISVSINLAAWASGKYSRGAVKMHTLLDLRGNIPTFIHISDGTWHDSNVMDYIQFESNAVYTMDKAYVDLTALNKMDSIGAYFVTRAKSVMRYRIIETMDTNEDDILADQLVMLTGHKSSRLYPKPLRIVQYRDAETNEELTFISNNMDISALDIANIYRNRWQIEVFFKWIKQNMTVKRMWGYSENAVRIHLWTAIISYLLMAKIKANLQTEYSITEVARILGVSALAKTPIRELLAKDQPTIENQNVKELKLF
ncbi:MAG: IS4 family transposase [Bacteroidales bacterium]|nr:IS4 family transposase [Bacteroidales bacterium]